MVGTSRLMMMFDAKDLTLKQWTVTDPQGLHTTVAISNLDSRKTQSESLRHQLQRIPGISSRKTRNHDRSQDR